MEKKAPKPFPTLEEIQRYNSVIVEEMRGQFKVLGESLTSFRKDVNSRFDRLEKVVLDTRERVSGVEGRLTKVEESNVRIESDIRIIKNQIKVKVDLEEFNALENRLVIVEKRLASLAS